jgi:hypothetical protein
MRSRHDRHPIDGRTATPFATAGTADRIARLLVLDMVLWPGVLFIGISLLATWQVRTNPVALAAFVLGTLFSVAVGVRQWDVMLHAVFPAGRHSASVPEPATPDPKEASPRPTGRGGTGR